MTTTDPRPAHRTIVTWVSSLVAGVSAEQWTLPTPCPEWDVRTLVGHLLAVVRRPALVGRGADPTAVSIIVTEIADADWAAAFTEAGEQLVSVWSDDELLDVTVRVPWGVVTGRDALYGYLNEALVHGWDLAVATGQPSEADPAAAGLALADARTKAPARTLPGAVLFGPEVRPAPGAGATERLANWLGHRRPVVDPRPAHRTALAWAHGLIAGVPLSLLTAPTPCSEWDVRALVGHLVATVQRATAIGEGADPWSVPSVVTGVADDAWADAFAEAGEKLWAVWADSALLDASVRVPWGEVTGREALFGYLNEALVHGWDLAVATGQPSEADPSVASLALVGARSKIPEGRRGGPIPFGAVVSPAPDAGPTERLANWSGHHRPVGQSPSGIRIQQAK